MRTSRPLNGRKAYSHKLNFNLLTELLQIIRINSRSVGKGW